MEKSAHNKISKGKFLHDPAPFLFFKLLPLLVNVCFKKAMIGVGITHDESEVILLKFTIKILNSISIY